MECEDFASSLAEKIKRLLREGHGRDRAPLNYRSFMFGKLPPPACPGLCYMCVCASVHICIYIYIYISVYVYIYIYVYVYIYIYKYLCVYTHVCMQS